MAAKPVSKPSPAASGEPAPLSVELARLEEIVRKLEADDVELDVALKLFEEGISRLRSARDQLGSAELTVQQVLEQAGNLRVTDLDG